MIVCNYRGITLLSTFGKPFTKFLNDRLNVWAEKYHVYIEAQVGFRLWIIFLYFMVS